MDTDDSTHREELCCNRSLTVISSVYLGLTWMCVWGGAVRPSAPLTLNIARPDFGRPQAKTVYTSWMHSNNHTSVCLVSSHRAPLWCWSCSGARLTTRLFNGRLHTDVFTSSNNFGLLKNRRDRIMTLQLGKQWCFKITCPTRLLKLPNVRSIRRQTGLVLNADINQFKLCITHRSEKTSRIRFLYFYLPKCVTVTQNDY